MTETPTIPNKPDKPAMVMVITLMLGEPDKHGKPGVPALIMKRNRPATEGEKPLLSLWEAAFEPEESVGVAAARCANAQFWRYPLRVPLERRDFMRVAIVPTPDVELWVTYFPRYLSRKGLRRNIQFAAIPIDKIGDRIRAGEVAETSILALQNLPEHGSLHHLDAQTQLEDAVIATLNMRMHSKAMRVVAAAESDSAGH